MEVMNMQKESITQQQASCILVMFIFGSTLVFGVGTEVGRDIWISLTLTIAMIIPAVLIYARIIRLFPGKNLFELVEELFGSAFGKVLTCVFVWYAIHLAASVLRNFTDFIQVTALPDTPQLPVAVLLLAVIVYLTKCGMEVFGKWALVTFIIICVIIPITVVLSVPSMKWSNLLPIMDNEWGDILTATYQQFSLPFGEVVLFLGVANSLRRENSPYKAYLYGILCAGAISIVILLRNITVLGPAMMESVYYPAFVAGRIINPSEFFARMESVIAMNYLFAGITKMSFCIFVAAKGMTRLFNLQDYKKLLIPVCLLCLMFSLISYNSVTHLFDFVKNYYPIYVIPFQILIPLLIWITAEIKRSRRNVLR
jgi:spore germination protein KB